MDDLSQAWELLDKAAEQNNPKTAYLEAAIGSMLRHLEALESKAETPVWCVGPALIQTSATCPHGQTTGHWVSAAGSPLITESPTTDKPWDALVRESMSHSGAISSQSDQPVTPSSPAGQGSECVHDWDWVHLEDWKEDWSRIRLECRCGASWWYAKTPALGVPPTTSTYPKAGSSPSAADPSLVDSIT